MKKALLIIIAILISASISAQLVIYQTYTVTGYETWDLSSYPDGVLIQDQLIIDNGGLLTINDIEINFAFQANVLVKIGGKLVAYNTSFKPFVDFEYWNGITVKGNPAYPYNNYAQQGILLLDENCILEGGFRAVWTDDGTGTHTGGGLIVVKNTTFKDCWASIELGSAPLGLALISYSSFLATDNVALYEYPVPYSDHVPPGIKSWQSITRIHNCEFISRATIVPLGSYAIGAIGGDLRAFNNTIYNWTVGVYGLSFDPTDILVVQDNEIKAYSEGVFLDRQTNSQVVRNEFEIGGSDGSHSGFFMESTNFIFEENHINNVGSWNSKYGLFIYETGPYVNEIYNNSFNNLYTGVKARYNQRLKNGTGLTIKCNKFTNSRYDIVNFVEDLGPGYGLAEYQGSMLNAPDASAGNEFSYYGIGYSDITNFGPHFNYIYHFQSSLNHEPINYTSYSVTKSPNLGTNAGYNPNTSCPCNFPQEGSDTLVPGDDELYTAMIEADNAAAEVSALIAQLRDGGNTYNVISNIVNGTPPEAYQIYLDLLQLSPYLSDEAIEAAIENEAVLPNAMIRDIMVANPHSAKEGELMESIDERYTPLPDEMKAEI